jgi:CopG family nickel-responsive transcriptional regulator
MQRVTITIDDPLMEEIDALIAERGYQNRSEAIRDLARAGLQQAHGGAPPGAHCVAALVYTYDHERRELPRRLANDFHHHHELSVSTLHVHLDRETCLEVNILKGKTPEVRHFAEHVIAQRGVRHGQLVMLPSETRS